MFFFRKHGVNTLLSFSFTTITVTTTDAGSATTDLWALPSENCRFTAVANAEAFNQL